MLALQVCTVGIAWPQGAHEQRLPHAPKHQSFQAPDCFACPQLRHHWLLCLKELGRGGRGGQGKLGAGREGRRGEGRGGEGEEGGREKGGRREGREEVAASFIHSLLLRRDVTRQRRE